MISATISAIKYIFSFISQLHKNYCIHRWNYYSKETFKFHIIRCRICKKCYKKQKMNIINNWIDIELTKSEKRDKKLKELGL
jgi:hypothetical protein